jgi:hypothetical protein
MIGCSLNLAFFPSSSRLFANRDLRSLLDEIQGSGQSELGSSQSVGDVHVIYSRGADVLCIASNRIGLHQQS